MGKWIPNCNQLLSGDKCSLKSNWWLGMITVFELESKLHLRTFGIHCATKWQQTRNFCPFFLFVLQSYFSSPPPSKYFFLIWRSQRDMRRTSKAQVGSSEVLTWLRNRRALQSPTSFEYVVRGKSKWISGKY